MSWQAPFIRASFVVSNFVNTDCLENILLNRQPWRLLYGRTQHHGRFRTLKFIIRGTLNLHQRAFVFSDFTFATQLYNLLIQGILNHTGYGCPSRHRRHGQRIWRLLRRLCCHTLYIQYFFLTWRYLRYLGLIRKDATTLGTGLSLSYR